MKEDTTSCVGSRSAGRFQVVDQCSKVPTGRVRCCWPPHGDLLCVPACRLQVFVPSQRTDGCRLVQRPPPCGHLSGGKLLLTAAAFSAPCLQGLRSGAPGLLGVQPMSPVHFSTLHLFCQVPATLSAAPGAAAPQAAPTRKSCTSDACSPLALHRAVPCCCAQVKMTDAAAAGRALAALSEVQTAAPGSGARVSSAAIICCCREAGCWGVCAFGMPGLNGSPINCLHLPLPSLLCRSPPTCFEPILRPWPPPPLPARLSPSLEAPLCPCRPPLLGAPLPLCLLCPQRQPQHLPLPPRQPFPRVLPLLSRPCLGAPISTRKSGQCPLIGSPQPLPRQWLLRPRRPPLPPSRLLGRLRVRKRHFSFLKRRRRRRNAVLCCQTRMLAMPVSSP